MTPIQHKIYVFIQEFIATHGYAPLLKEIALGVGINPKSKSFISRCVHALIEKGLLDMDGEARPRNIKLIKPSGKKYLLPIVGRIAAGSPIEAISQMETLDLNELFCAEDHFVLESKGESMVNEGILNGDKIICKHQEMAQDGDIVVALIDNVTATLKRIYFKPEGKVTLIPANAQLEAKEYEKDRIKIQGVFVGLVRVYKKV